MNRYADYNKLLGGLLPPAAADVRSGNIYMTNVTNIANVTQAVQKQTYQHSFRRNHSKPRGDGYKRKHHEHPPKHYRYTASCGLFDARVAYGMESDELLVEGAKVVGYAARQVGFSACKTVGHLASAVGNVGKVGKGVCGLVSGIFGMVSAFFE